ncbi:MAG TPA: NapC/NirT family cytochrome c [Woeseiaceae bacterium]|nr:NapC/NirT family cytochrome c [Woeseiaceae bacterium]
MARTPQDAPSESRLARLWKKPRSKLLLGIPVGGFLLFLGGIVFWGGFNTALEWSNQEAFCISCHEMKDNVYKEYTGTVHYSNASGVRAICSDCHVPKEWGPKVLRKMRASMHELPGWIFGTIDTREKFLAKRLELATNEWRRMLANDSHECRNCHELNHMDLAEQGRSASRKHIPERVAESGDTCISCHQGIAHELPDGWSEIELWKGD